MAIKKTKQFPSVTARAPDPLFTAVNGFDHKPLDPPPFDAKACGMSSLTKTDIFLFDSFAPYLHKVVEERKNLKSTNSLRQLSQRAGFRSAASLSMLMTGKRRLTVESAEKLATALGLSGRRKRYLLALARKESARDQKARSQALREMQVLRSAVTETEIESHQYKFFSRWYYSALYVLAGNPDFTTDPDDLFERLGRRIKKEEITEALETLVALGLIEKVEEKYVQKFPALTTRDDLRNTAVYLYHKAMNELAGEALQLPIEDREFNGLTVSITQERLAGVKERIRRFRHELNEYLSQFSECGEVYQMNFQIFPLTQPRPTKEPS